MRIITALFFAAFFATSVLAQDQIQETQPLVQTDTTSGWQLVFSKPKLYFSMVQFPSKDTGYAIASDNSIPAFATKIVLFRSTNQGATWDSIGLPPFTTPLLPTYYFLSSQVGYCNSGISDSSIIWKTIDGGITWQPHPRNANAPGPICFANRDTGVTLGHTEIARTTNGGETWSKVFPQVGNAVNAVSFGDARTGYGVGIAYFDVPHNANSGYCEKTTDAGFTWSEVYTGIPANLTCCQVLEANTVVVGSISQYVGKTTNGGQTWDTISLVNSNSGFSAISFFNKRHGFIVGAEVINSNFAGIIFATTDGGLSWQHQFLLNAPWLHAVDALNDSVAVVCGGGNIYRTSTSGKFSSVSQQNVNFQIHIFPNPSSGIITIQYQIPSPSSVSYQITDIQGIEVGVMNLGVQNYGTQQMLFDASSLANGAYYLKLSIGANQQTALFTIQK